MPHSRSRFALLLGAAIAIALVNGETAQAFYWVNWPGRGTSSSGSGGTSTGTVTTTGKSTGTTGGSGGTVSVTGDPSGSQIPEPATLVIGLVGLGSWGLVRRLRRK